MEKIQLTIQGMTCGHCEKSVSALLQQLKGVKSSSVSLKDAKAEISFDPAVISKQEIIDQVNATAIYHAQ